MVRSLLVPALVSLFGKWNWWLPAGVAKVLRVEPSPLREDSEPGPTVPEPATVGASSAAPDDRADEP